MHRIFCVEPLQWYGNYNTIRGPFGFRGAGVSPAFFWGSLKSKDRRRDAGATKPARKPMPLLIADQVRNFHHDLWLDEKHRRELPK